MDNILLPLVGGILIGLASSLILFSLGRVTGISGIFASSLIDFTTKAESWKYFFLFGLILGGVILKILYPALFAFEISGSIPLIISAGLLVGFGTRLGSGCTSGHGVCGLPRKSLRSLVATLTFMGAGVITVFLKGLL